MTVELFFMHLTDFFLFLAVMYLAKATNSVNKCLVSLVGIIVLQSQSLKLLRQKVFPAAEEEEKVSADIDPS